MKCVVRKHKKFQFTIWQDHIAIERNNKNNIIIIFFLQDNLWSLNIYNKIIGIDGYNKYDKYINL